MYGEYFVKKSCELQPTEIFVIKFSALKSNLSNELGGGVCPGDVCPRGCLHRGRCLHRGGVCLGGVSQHAMGQTSLPVNRIMDRCKNITLPQTSFASGKY